MAPRDKKKRTKSRSSGGSTLSGLRQGFKGVVGRGGNRQKKPESTLSKVINYLLLAVLLGLLIYRLTR